MYSLIVSAKMNGIDPQAWLADVLARIAGHPAHRLDEFCRGIGGRRRPRSLPSQPDVAPVNKIGHVYTIPRVAEMLGEDEDWLGDVANEMDQKDGLIWV
jgi:hypothetical protein